MRILLLSDLHANWPALEAISEPHDVCLCLGDLVDYGCDPAPVIDWVRKRAAVCVRGNHDHMVAQNVLTAGIHGFRYLSGVTRSISRDRITESSRLYLASLPLTRFLTLGGKRFLLVHATPRDPLDEYAPGEADAWRRHVENIGVDVVCVGHTHQAFELTLGGVRIINPGSVGLSRDGDPRASYAIWEDGVVTFKRFEYDVERAVRSVETSGLPDQAKQMLRRIYRGGSLTNGTTKSHAALALQPAVARI
jgi:putative phosphoesterase